MKTPTRIWLSRSIVPQREKLVVTFKSWTPSKPSQWKGLLIFLSPLSSHIYSICLMLPPLNRKANRHYTRKRPVSWPTSYKTRSAHVAFRLCSRSRQMLFRFLEATLQTMGLGTRSWKPPAAGRADWFVAGECLSGSLCTAFKQMVSLSIFRCKWLQSHLKTKQDSLDLWCLESVIGSGVIPETLLHILPSE